MVSFILNQSTESLHVGPVTDSKVNYSIGLPFSTARDRPFVSFTLLLFDVPVGKLLYGNFFFPILLLRNKQLLFRGQGIVGCFVLFCFSLPSKTHVSGSFSVTLLKHSFIPQSYFWPCIISLEGDGLSMDNSGHMWISTLIESSFLCFHWNNWLDLQKSQNMVVGNCAETIFILYF